MKTNDVPQDDAPTYGGHKKIFYAINHSGKYELAPSTGWKIESDSTLSAINELERLKQEAAIRIQQNISSPLEWHMYDSRMDPELLAQTTGIFKWRIKRHLKPLHFSKLKISVLNKYSEALGKSIETLQQVPNELTQTKDAS